MDAQDMQERIAAASRTIYTWSLSRISSPQDAEDLAQDIAVELLRSLPNLRDEQAFYGFMWGVARNVYRAWLRRKQRTAFDELPQELPAPAPDPDGEGEELRLLRRELALLAEDAEAIAAMAKDVMEAVSAILQEHLPVHLRHLHQGMAYLRLFEDAISVPMALLLQDGFLRPAVSGELLPTTYVIWDM